MLRGALHAHRALLRPSRARALSTVRFLPSTACRQLALPLAFLAVKGWDSHGLQGWDDWLPRFSQRGYSSLLVEVDPATVPPQDTAAGTLAALEQELVRLLRDPAHSSPFPPLLFAHSSASLLAETYVSSHPLSGLCLVSPLPAPLAQQQLPDALKTGLEEFNYEPGFPIAVVEQEGRKGGEEHRLLREFADEEDEDALVRLIKGKRDAGTFARVQEWMDENGL
ncbi:hypothetical protein JCM8097_002615 [Rhodosporidiobolus ruineniae]